jgi:hypothetical protein
MLLGRIARFCLTQYGVYLEELHNEAFRINATKKLVRDHNYLAALTPAERAQQSLQLESDKLNFANKITDLVREFESFLTLRDFSNSIKRRKNAETL